MNTKQLLLLLPLFAATALVSSSAEAQVVLPYFEGFEGTNGQTYASVTPVIAGAPDWRYDPETADGRLRLDAGANFPRSGTKAATLDATGFAFVTNFLTATLDMSTYDANVDVIVLDFSTMQHGDEDDADDAVWVRGSMTDTFIKIGDLGTLTPSSNGTYGDIVDLDISAALVGASQNYSTTFQLRFGQRDDFDATSTTSLDGRTFDDIRIRRVLNNDVGVTAILTPQLEVCGAAAQDIIVEVTNFGANPQSDIDLQVTLAGAFVDTFDVVVPGPLAKNESVMVTVGTVDTQAGGDVTIAGTTALGTDEDNANDSASDLVTVRSSLVPFVAPANVCPGDPGMITVTQETESAYVLYEDMVGGLPVSSGATLVTTPPLDANATFYLERANDVVGVGPVDTTLGTPGPYATLTDGLTFTAKTDLSLEGVHVYPGGVGDVEVRLLSSSGTELARSAKVTIAAADVDMKVFIPLDFTVPAGSGYRLDAKNSTVPSLVRNSNGASFPYTSSKLDITGTISGLTEVYYFFYDWSFVALTDTCSTPRTPVDLVVDASACTADLSVTVDAPAEVMAGDQLDYTITVSNNGPTGATNVSVAFTPDSGLTFIGNSGACTDSFPCTIPALASGTSAVVTAVYVVNSDASGVMSSSTTVSADTPEDNPGDETDSVDTTVTDDMGTGGGGAGGMGPGGAGGEDPVGSGGMGGNPATTTSTGGGGTDDPPVDEGCSCSAPGNQGGSDYRWLLVGGVAIVMGRRRRRAA